MQMSIRRGPAAATVPGRTLLPRARLARGLLMVAALALAAIVLRNPIFGAPVEVREVTRRDLVQTVVASGRVTTPQRVSVSTVITEAVVKIPVAEGQAVRRGDVLIELDDRDERAAVAQAQAAVAQAEAKLRQLRELGLPAAEQSLVQAQANQQLARRQYERNRGLKAQGFVSQAALDDAQRNLDVAESQLDAAQLQVETHRPQARDFALAQTALAQARAGLAAAHARLEQTVIRAPVDGTLIARSVEPGNVVQSGKELMVLAPAGETQIVVQIDEKNLAQLSSGQQALGVRRRLPERALRRGARLHQSRHRRAARLGRGEAAGERARRLPAAGHDGIRRHRSRASMPRRSSCPPTRCTTPQASQPWVLAIVDGRATRQGGHARPQGRRPRRGPGRRGPGRPPHSGVARRRAGPARARRRRARTRREPFAPFEWIVAFRFMREGLTQTLLIIFGVGLGGGVIIFMSALLAGLQATSCAARSTSRRRS